MEREQSAERSGANGREVHTWSAGVERPTRVNDQRKQPRSKEKERKKERKKEREMHTAGVERPTSVAAAAAAEGLEAEAAVTTH